MQLEKISLMHRAVIGGDYDAVKATGYTPRPGVKPIPFALPFSWKHTDKNTAFQLHSWRFLSPFFQKFLDTKDAQYVNEAITYMRDWYRFQGETQAYTFLWYDMATGIRSIALALIISLEATGHITLAKEDRDFVYLLSDLHKQNLSNEGNITAGNHAVHQLLGLRILSIATADESTEDFCTRMLARIIDEGFDENFVNTENSPFYHHFNVKLLNQIRGSLFPKLDKRIREIVKNGTDISGWMTDHNGDFYCIGDTEGKGVPFQWTGPADPLDLSGEFVHKDLHKSGYIFVRSAPSTPIGKEEALVFHATNKTYIHGHADHLSFILVHKGVEIFTDSGKYTYNYDKWRSYVSSDAAHNTVGLESIVFGPADTPIGGAELETVVLGDSSYVLAGKVARGQLFTTSRRIQYAPGHEMSIMDSVSNLTGSAVVIRFHLGIGLNVEDHAGSYLILKDGVPLAELFPDTVSLQDTSIKDGWVSKRYQHKVQTETLQFGYDSNVDVINTHIKLL